MTINEILDLYDNDFDFRNYVIGDTFFIALSEIIRTDVYLNEKIVAIILLNTLNFQRKRLDLSKLEDLHESFLLRKEKQKNNELNKMNDKIKE